MTRSRLQNLALIAVTLVVCLGGAELFFRMFPQFLSEEAQLRLHWEELGETDDAHSMTVSDPRLGYLVRPHFTGQISRGDFRYTFHTDEHGFRNPSPWPKQADIVVVGDSLVFGDGANDDQAWPRLVAEALPGIDVINLGVSGFGPQQYLRVLEAFGLDLHPKLVLFMLFSGNDLKDADAFQRWVDADIGVPYAQWRDQDYRRGDLGPWRGLLERSRLVTFLRGARVALTSRLAGGTIDFADGRRVQLAPTYLREETELSHPGDPALELALATIERARAVTREHGAHLLVLLMPTKEEVYLPRIGKPAPPLVEPLRAGLESRGIPFLDLTPDLEAHARDAAPLFYEIDGHPNADGYRLIAQVVADHLKEFGSRYGLPDHPEIAAPGRSRG